MNCQDPPVDVREPWIAEHQDLQLVMSRARDAIVEHCLSPGEIGALVTQLLDRLAAHFRNEEQGGYFDEVMAAAPRFHARVDLLVRQHCFLKELLESLRRRVNAGARSQASWLEAQAIFERFLRNFQEHEAAETKLLQEAYTDDLGQGD